VGPGDQVLRFRIPGPRTRFEDHRGAVRGASGDGQSGEGVRGSRWPGTGWRSATGGTCGRRPPVGTSSRWAPATTGRRPGATCDAPGVGPGPSSALPPGSRPSNAGGPSKEPFASWPDRSAPLAWPPPTPAATHPGRHHPGHERPGHPRPPGPGPAVGTTPAGPSAPAGYTHAGPTSPTLGYHSRRTNPPVIGTTRWVRRVGWRLRGRACTSCLNRRGRVGCGRPSCRCGVGAGWRRLALRPR
jgi:hypothetical protein